MLEADSKEGLLWGDGDEYGMAERYERMKTWDDTHGM
jgi:hypothetical protein